MSREQPPFMRCVIGGVRLLVSLATGLRSAVRGVARPGIPGARRWNHERMADDDPSGDRVAKEWPLEGHFVVDGSGLHVHTDCLGASSIIAAAPKLPSVPTIPLTLVRTNIKQR